MRRHLASLFERAAVFEVGGDAGAAEGVVAHLGGDSGRLGAPVHHLPGIGPVKPLQLSHERQPRYRRILQSRRIGRRAPAVPYSYI